MERLGEIREIGDLVCGGAEFEDHEGGAGDGA